MLRLKDLLNFQYFGRLKLLEEICRFTAKHPSIKTTVETVNLCFCLNSNFVKALSSAFVMQMKKSSEYNV